LLERLGSRLYILTSGSQDTPERQRTLRGAIAWSYDLLDDDEKALYRRMSVFMGATSLEAIEAIASTDSLPPLMGDSFDLVASLADQSMVRHTDAYGEPRFWMLWTLKEFGWERLAEAGEEQAIKSAHARYFLGLAEQAVTLLSGPEQAEWLNRLESDHPNLRIALEWSKAHEPETFSRLVAALWRFWHIRGYFSEGRQWLEAAMAFEGLVPPATVAEIYYGAGLLARHQGSYEPARRLFSGAQAIFEQAGNFTGVADMLNNLGVLAVNQADLPEAVRLFQRCLDLHQQSGNQRGVAASLNNLAHVARVQGRYDEARRRLEQAIPVLRAAGELRTVAIALNNLGHVARNQGDYGAAHTLYTESHSVMETLGDKMGMASALDGLGEVACSCGEYEEAEHLLQDGLTLYREIGHKEGMVGILENLARVARKRRDFAGAQLLYLESMALLRDLKDRQAIGICLLGLAELEYEHGKPERAARLLGASEGLLDEVGAALEPTERAEYEHSAETVRTLLGDATYQEVWRAGHAMTMDQAISEACRRL
jgi:tetratricopeptide (TPR) repeat protein